MRNRVLMLTIAVLALECSTSQAAAKKKASPIVSDPTVVPSVCKDQVYSRMKFEIGKGEWIEGIERVDPTLTNYDPKEVDVSISCGGDGECIKGAQAEVTYEGDPSKNATSCRIDSLQVDDDNQCDCG